MTCFVRTEDSIQPKAEVATPWISGLAMAQPDMDAYWGLQIVHFLFCYPAWELGNKEKQTKRSETLRFVLGVFSIKLATFPAPGRGTFFSRLLPSPNAGQYSGVVVRHFIPLRSQLQRVDRIHE